MSKYFGKSKTQHIEEITNVSRPSGGASGRSIPGSEDDFLEDLISSPCDFNVTQLEADSKV